jgi:hypothetical protein
MHESSRHDGVLTCELRRFYENPRYARLADEHDGFAPPEARLHVSMIGAVLLPIGIFIFAATAYPVRIHWIASMIATVPFGSSLNQFEHFSMR